MKLSLLYNLLRNEIESDKFKSLIQQEVSEYGKKLQTKGTSVPILVDEDCSLYIGKKDLLQLCNLYLDRSLTSIYINYIADCLTLSEYVTFENEEIHKLLEEMTDPEINGEITPQKMRSILKVIE